MHIYRSNRMERLFDALAGVVESTPDSAFEPQTIVVQSKGMERWISLQLATRFGIWANPDFPFPRAFIERVFDATSDGPSAADRYDREVLLWTVADLIPPLLASGDFAPVQNYLSDGDDVKKLELCRRIAYAFDQYAVYRPEILLEWAGRANSNWQATLWQRIVSRHGPHYVAARAERFFTTWPALGSPPLGLPSTVCVFGISSLPPLYVRVLEALSSRIDVHFFHLTATPTWPEADVSSAEPSLLSSLGAIGRDFESILRPCGAGTDVFEEPGYETMLRAVQSDLVAFRRRGRGAGERPPVPVSVADDSISVHSCHSPMREVEVLRDQLLDCFDRDATLEPHDVVVMMPNVETYAPLIDAVFGMDPGSPGYIPYTIADRTIRSDNALADAVLSILTALSGRMKASEVLDLLAIEPIRLKFGISADNLPDLQALVREAGIRWGIDRAHRASAGQPAQDENTWRFGLRRLLLGYALEGRNRILYAETLPYDGVEGDIADAVGRLSEFVETLFAFRDDLQTPRSPSAWAGRLDVLVDGLLATDHRTEWQRNAVREVFDEISATATAGGFQQPISLVAITSLLSERLDSERTSHDFLSGGVTFCAMLPMRSIPFKVVCVLGLNDSDFPRAERPASFDIVACEPRLGDRSPREEDRYLFLEAILSARDRLVLSYLGRSAHDNAEFPPSIVVADLKATLDVSFTVAPSGSAQLALPFHAAHPCGSAVVVHHRLQAFSTRYFSKEDRRLFSFSLTNAEGARALAEPSTASVRFQQAPLDAELVSVLTLDDLARFLQNPARALLQRQLGVYLEEELDKPQDREPDDLDPLANYAVGAVLLEQALEGYDIRKGLTVARARGVLPLGTPGQAAFCSVLPTVHGLEELAQGWLDDTRLPALDVDLEIDGVALQGTLSDLYPTAQIRLQYGRLRAKTELGFWLRHLALQCVAPAGHPRRSILIGRALEEKTGVGVQARLFEPLEASAARARLSELVELYKLGQRAPLSFFPVASRRFVECLRRGGDGFVENAFYAAKRAFTGRQSSEADDEYIQRIFTGVDPFVERPVPVDEDGALGLPSFARIACTVFGPLFDCSHTEDR